MHLQESNTYRVFREYILLKGDCKTLDEDYSKEQIFVLTLNLLMTTIVAPPSNAIKWQMGYNSAFKGLKNKT